MTYRLGIDVGPNHTTWATIADGPKHRPATGHVDNVVGLRSDGSVVAGDAVRSSADVLHTATGFMGRLGQSEPLMVGGTPFGAESLVGHVLATVLGASRDLHGADPVAVVLVHDDGLDQYRIELLGEAARLAGVPTTAISVASRSEALAAGGGAVGAAALGWQRTPDPEVPDGNTAATVAGGAAAGGAVGAAAAAALGGGGVAEALGTAAGPMGTPLSAAAAPGTPLGAAPGAPLSAPGAAPGTPLTAPGAAPGTPLSAPGAAPGTPLTPPGGAAPGTPLPTGGAAPGTPLSPPTGGAPGSPLSPPSGGTPSGGTPSGSGTPGGAEPAPSGSGTPTEPATPTESGTPDAGTPEAGGSEPGTPSESSPADTGTPDTGTGGSGTGRPPRLDPTRPAIDLVKPVVKSPFPWVKVAAIVALLGVTGGTLAWFLTRGDDGSVAPASTPATSVVATSAAATSTEAATTTATPTTVAPAVTGVALTTTVPATLPPTTPATTVPAPTTTVKAPTKTVPTTTVKLPVGVATTPPPTTVAFFPIIVPPLLLNLGPSISNLLVSPASVSSCGQNVSMQVTLTDADGVASANATITYLVGGVTRTGNVKLSPLKGTAWAGTLLISLGDVVNQPASVKITAYDTKKKAAVQTFTNKFTVLPCIIG